MSFETHQPEVSGAEVQDHAALQLSIKCGARNMDASVVDSQKRGPMATFELSEFS